jgi:hypothetical protein
MRLLREPLLHFAVLGVALFALHRQLAPADESQPITVDANLTAALRADHQRRTGATPTAEEEDALLERHLDSEVLYRAALDLGLERGDVIVRRRLIQKMEFILENAQPRPEPPDTELQAYLEAHAERYALPERLSLTHVFVSNERAGGQAVAETEALRQQLLDGAAPEGLGDPFLHGRRLTGRSLQELRALFGPAWTRSVQALDAGAWSAPIASSYGWHLVRVDDRVPGSLPPLSQVRARVREDWENAQRDAARRHGIERLRAKYGVQRAQAGGQKP